MNPLSFIIASFGFILMLCGMVGNHTGTMDALEIHSCYSEGMLMLIFAMVFHLCTKEK